MKKQILLLLLILTINIQPQEDWLKANLDNQWQFIKNTNNDHYELVVGKFVNSFNINDTVFYEYNLSPFSTKKMRYDSVSNSIIYICDSNQRTHFSFSLPNGSYPDLVNYNSYSLADCATGITVNSMQFIFASNNYNAKKISWDYFNYPFHNDQHSTVYANGLGIVYHYTLYRNYFNLYLASSYTLFQCKVDDIIYKNEIPISFQINPILIITNQNFQLVFRVIHPQNRIFPVNTGYTSLVMIDTVWFHSFYEKDGDTLFIEKQQAGWMAGTDNYILNKVLNLGLLSQGYSFNYRIEAIDKGFSPNKAYSPENGYYKAYLDTTISVDHTKEKLMDYELEQNYPNPFNSTTKIRFFVPKEDEIVIDIYDVLGQQVIRIFEDRVTTGRYEVELNSEMINSMNSSSIYFYRMKSSEKMITKKMLIQK